MHRVTQSRGSGMFKINGFRGYACGVVAMVAAAFASGSVSAAPDDFPTKRVHIISAHPAGSGPDVAVRLVAEQLTKKWGQPVIVENKPGGNGFIAIQAVQQGQPDGHDLLLFDTAHVTTHPYTFNKLPYDPDKDIALVGPLFKNGFFVAVPKDSSFQ